MLQSLTDQLVTTGVSNPDRHYPLPRLDISATEGRFWRSLHRVSKSGSSSSPFYGLIVILNSSELYVTKLFLTHQTKVQVKHSKQFYNKSAGLTTAMRYSHARGLTAYKLHYTITPRKTEEKCIIYIS